ncbi:MAG TPA: hypothetical protein VKO63_10620 [Chitinispirillaceae bacterium]|nr:hypothetical protein [Chitinispirillaceae bacterium]
MNIRWPKRDSFRGEVMAKLQNFRKIVSKYTRIFRDTQKRGKKCCVEKNPHCIFSLSLIPVKTL